MATILKIVKKSNAFTGMRIFRSENKAQVYASVPIADTAIADSYADETAESGKAYFYGVELYHATDKTQLPIISATDVKDYGSFTSIVTTNLAKFSTPVTSGDMKLGFLQRATVAQFSGQPGPANTGEKMREILVAAVGAEPRTKVTADTVVTAGIIDGKLVVLPSIVNFYLRSEYGAENVVGDITKIRDYLKNNPAQALVNIAGYQWRVKIATKEFMTKASPFFISTTQVGVPRQVPHATPLSYQYMPYLFTISEVDGSVSKPSPDVNGIDVKFTPFNINEGTNEGRGLYMYFEYAGPTPV